MRALRLPEWIQGIEPLRRLLPREALSGLGRSWNVVRKTSQSLFRATSLLLACVCVVFIVLEMSPRPGAILERLGAEIASGWLIQLVLIGFLFDSLRGMLPRAVALIPLVFYCSYYIAYWQQGVHVQQVSNELRRSNPTRVFDFNSKLHSLVMDQADVFAATHSIPVVYAREPSYFKEGYLSYRLIERNKIKEYLRIDPAAVQIFTVNWDGRIQANVRELRFPERPRNKIVDVTVHDDHGEGWRDWNIGYSTTFLNVDGRVVGEFKTGSVRRLPIVPLFMVGCKFPGEPGRPQCSTRLATEQTSIESRPYSVDPTLYPDPVSAMTGIKALADYDVAHFHNSDAGSDMMPRVAPDEDAAFAALQEIIDGRDPPVAPRTSELIAGNPARLAPFASAMTKRFLALNDSKTAEGHGRSNQIGVLVSAIEALRPAEFATVQDVLSDFARTNSSLVDTYPFLYLRLADAGPKLYSIYRDQFLAQNATPAQKLLALTAICRLGQADTELMSTIASEWDKFNAGELTDSRYQSALFVLLLKFGQKSQKSLLKSHSSILKDWYEAVREGRGKTEAGPNNCMPIDWLDDGYIPDVLAPSLRLSNDRWIAAD